MIGSRPGRSGHAWSDDPWASGEDEQDYWVSYADLLAGLLMVFALMLLTTLSHYQGRVTEVRDLLQTRRQIITELQKRLGDAEGVNVAIDSTSGSVRFDGKVLFKEDEARLLPQGKTQLRAFAAQYLPVLLGTEHFRDELDAIVIEGHTNDNGTYMYNLDLSQRRAFNVMAFLIQNASGYAGDLRKYVTANGRSFSDPICVDQRPCGPGQPGAVDDVRSRRIEIRFRLKNKEVIQKIIERLFFSDS